ncbi:MAG: EAL domain-containing protein [Firmicutes bacterium]|nr:EAL domain-containing protein [Bacillota bacterium]
MDRDDLKLMMNKENVAEYFEEIFRIFSETSEGKYVFLCDMEEDLSYWSQEAVDYFGLPSNRVHDMASVWIPHVHPDTREAYVANLTDVFSGKLEWHDLTYRALNKDGQYVTCSCKGKVIKGKNGELKFFAGTITNHELNVSIDPVTGLYGRTSLIDTLRIKEIQKKPYFLITVGMRGFFDINNAYGFKFGNKVLKAVSDKLYSLGKAGYVYKCDGTKFAILIDSDAITKEEICTVFGELREYLLKDLQVDGTHIVVNVVGNYYENKDFSIDSNTLYNTAMYTISKLKEENISQLYDLEIELGGRESFRNNNILKIVSAARQDVLDGCRGFYLVYQPIVNAKTDKIEAMEALLRWESKDYGTVPPGVFIPYLERDPVFYELGKQILKMAMEDAEKIISADKNFVVNINLAYPQLQRQEFKKDIVEITKGISIEPRNIKLELTERCRLINKEALRDDMIYFKSIGFKTALDDFGTGYSSISLLAELPVDQIKIDKSFIDDIMEDVSKQSLLRAISNCAHELDKSVCVEGIEDEKMRDYIRNNFTVSDFQGYYYSRPVPIEKIMEYMRENAG